MTPHFPKSPEELAVFWHAIFLCNMANGTWNMKNIFNIKVYADIVLMQHLAKFQQPCSLVNSGPYWCCLQIRIYCHWFCHLAMLHLASSTTRKWDYFYSFWTPQAPVNSQSVLPGQICQKPWCCAAITDSVSRKQGASRRLLNRIAPTCFSSNTGMTNVKKLCSKSHPS